MLLHQVWWDEPMLRRIRQENFPSRASLVYIREYNL